MKFIANFIMLVISVDHRNTYAELNLNFQQNDYQFKFERVELTYCNKEFIQDISCKTFKYNRSIAVVNATVITNTDLGSDITIVIQVYKFMSNEYRFYPIHFAANVDKAFKADVLGIRSGVSRCGNFARFPLRKGTKYYLCNWYPDTSKLPPLIPDGQFKIEAKVLHPTKEIGVVNMYGTVSRPIWSEMY